MRIQAALLDMDGVIFDTERMGLDYFPEIGREIGCAITREDAIEMLGKNYGDCGAYLRGRYGAAFPFEHVFERFYQYLLRAAQDGVLPEKAGLRGALQTLRARGIKLAVATSNSERIVRSYLSHMGLLKSFDALACGDHVRRGKPAPDVFLYAASLLHVPPAACVGVEDSESGLRAIRAAGMRAIMVPDLTPYSDRLAPYVDAVCETLDDVPGAIAAFDASDALDARL